MTRPSHIPASVLPVVLIVSVIMLVIILGLLSLWEINFLFFSRNDYIRTQRNHIESFFTLYCAHPQVAASLDADSTFLLYDDNPLSRVKVTISPWGLYESVCVSSLCGKVRVCRLLGADGDDGKTNALWYRNSGSALTLTGRSDIVGPAALPSNGIIYGQMQSVFFSGHEISPSFISRSEDKMPLPDDRTAAVVEDIFSYIGSPTDVDFTSVAEADFLIDNTIHIATADGRLYDGSYNGNIIITGDRIRVDSTCRLRDVIIVGNYIEVADGVTGVFQAFAKDSINVGEGAMLDFPSGIYSENRIRIGERSTVNGYVVNNFNEDKDVSVANTVKTKSSKVRGFYYSRGVSQIQGIITGTAYIDESVFYSPRGYYRNLLYEASFIASTDNIANPLWFDREKRRKTAGWQR